MRHDTATAAAVKAQLERRKPTEEALVRIEVTRELWCTHAVWMQKNDIPSTVFHSGELVILPRENFLLAVL